MQAFFSLYCIFNNNFSTWWADMLLHCHLCLIFFSFFLCHFYSIQHMPTFTFDVLLWPHCKHYLKKKKKKNWCPKFFWLCGSILLDESFLKITFLSLWGSDKVAYILPFSNPTCEIPLTTLLLVSKIYTWNQFGLYWIIKIILCLWLTYKYLRRDI